MGLTLPLPLLLAFVPSLPRLRPGVSVKFFIHENAVDLRSVGRGPKHSRQTVGGNIQIL